MIFKEQDQCAKIHIAYLDMTLEGNFLAALPTHRHCFHRTGRNICDFPFPKRVNKTATNAEAGVV